MVPELLQNLKNTTLYDHRVSSFEILETHISWILLTGQYAYKIKKPVNFEFVDFSTLAKRRFYCYEELRLNRRLAPELYLDVCAITGSDGRPVIGGPGQAIEYMVKMKQFKQQDLLNNLVNRNQISHQHIHSLANIIAAFHQTIKPASLDSIYGNPEQIYHWVEQNFTQIQPLLQTKSQLKQLDQLHEWTTRAYLGLEDKLAERKLNAYVRECHGDLHLGNIALVDSEITIFDGIEFNDELRWIDVINEIAFLMMDLADKNKPSLANRFLDQYLTVSGDYDGLSILSFYLVYRALVRGKIDLLKSTQQSIAQHHTHAVTGDYLSYVDLALGFTQRQPAVLFITHGLAGSGKSTLASKVAHELGVIRIRSDVERKRMFGLSAKDRTASNIGSGIYTSDATHKTYAYLAKLCETVIKAGYSVIIDAGFLQKWQRSIFQHLAQVHNLKFVILDLQVPVEELRRRVEDRWRKHNDPSEANLDVLESQLCKHTLLTSDEQVHSITIESIDKNFREIKIQFDNHQHTLLPDKYSHRMNPKELKNANQDC